MRKIKSMHIRFRSKWTKNFVEEAYKNKLTMNYKAYIEML